MAPRKPTVKDPTAAVQSSKADTGAGVAKRQYKKVRLLENGLLDVERKTGKFFKIARQNQHDSPLLRLPPEIRNQIYSYVLGGRALHLRYSNLRVSPRFCTIAKSTNALALLAVCRQIYAETVLLPYSLNTFFNTLPERLGQWLEDIRPIYASRIASIKVGVYMGKFPRHSAFRGSQYDIDDLEYLMSTTLFQKLQSLRYIDVCIIAVDESREGKEAILPTIIEHEEALKTHIKALNPRIQVVITRELCD